jgi:hypothetical protein
LLVIDTPFDGEFAARLQYIVRDVDCERDAQRVDLLLKDERFDAVLDNDFYLSNARRRAHPDVFAHLSRLHAANAVAIAQHRQPQVRAPMLYALAARGKSATTRDQLVAQLRKLTTGEITVKVFDDDHNSIVREPSAHALSHFAGDETAAAAPDLRVTQA